MRTPIRLSAAQGDLLDARLARLGAVLGRDFADNSVPIDAAREGVRLTGHAALPTLNKPTTQGQYLFVNGRPVRDKLLLGALRGAYADFLARDRHPMAVLFIDLPFEQVDVNVHPTKAEVRFRDSQMVRGLIVTAIRHALAQAGHRASSTVAAATIESFRPQAAPPAVPAARYPTGPGWGRAPVPATPPARLMEEAASWFAPLTVPSARPGDAGEDAAAAPEPAVRHPLGAARAQVHANYIVAQTEDGIVIVDQHAAHERINYERYYEKFGNPEAVSQLTMFSHTIEFTSAEAQTIRERLPLLESVGVYLEPFGGNTFKVRAHPSWFPPGEEAAIIEEMAQWVLSARQPDVAKIREASAIMVSCKASVKANQAQTTEALAALIRRLADCANPFTCPHGRPIIVSFTKRDLEKMFKRVM